MTPGDADSLVGVIRRLAADPALRADMGARARQTMIERWGVQHALAQWKELLDTLDADIAPHAEGRGKGVVR